MRKSIFMALVLLVLAAGSICFLHGLVNRQRDAVQIDEAVLFGDRAAAENITLECNTNCRYNLFWNTSCRIGEELTVKTDFTFSPHQRHPMIEPTPELYIYPKGNCTIGSNSAIQLGEESNFLLEPTIDVAGRTPPGQERQETLNLRDYYDYYPLQVDFGSHGRGLYDQRQADVAEFFKFPIKEDCLVQISVTKNSAGDIVQIENRSISDGIYLKFSSVITDTGYYMVYSNNTQDGMKLDTGSIPGGYGIYCIPLDRDGESVVYDTAKIQNVFPLDEQSTDAVELALSSDGSELLLIAAQNKTYKITAIDPSTMTERQSTELIDQTADVFYGGTEVYEDFLVTVFSNGDFVLTSLSSGVYERQFAANMLSFGDIGYAMMYGAHMDYNGDRLAIAAPRDTYAYCGFYLAVYDQTGLLYFGEYSHSSDRVLTTGNYSPPRPNDIEPLTVGWSD